MGVSKLKLLKVCEHCGKAFEARTFNTRTRFCSSDCNNAFLRFRKKQALEEERKQQILQESKAAIAEIQTCPYISIAEAVVLFGVSLSTVDKTIRKNSIPKRQTQRVREYLNRTVSTVEWDKKRTPYRS